MTIALLNLFSIIADAFRVCDEKFESSLKAVLPKFGVTELRTEQKQARFIVNIWKRCVC